MSPRSKHLSIRFTQEELNLVRRTALTHNRKAADWARLLILDACRELSPDEADEKDVA